mmetsp:Transcript_38649/g.98859  ORF Transcript_38649/g.98859 Transcript_38649/m.98859 type:complete len:260 (-) Transcript_38649:227-1006(-)
MLPGSSAAAPTQPVSLDDLRGHLLPPLQRKPKLELECADGIPRVVRLGPVLGHRAQGGPVAVALRDRRRLAVDAEAVKHLLEAAARQHHLRHGLHKIGKHHAGPVLLLHTQPDHKADGVQEEQRPAVRVDAVEVADAPHELQLLRGGARAQDVAEVLQVAAAREQDLRDGHTLCGLGRRGLVKHREDLHHLLAGAEVHVGKGADDRDGRDVRDGEVEDVGQAAVHQVERVDAADDALEAARLAALPRAARGRRRPGRAR